MNWLKNKTQYIFPILFAILTLAITIFHIPYWDETHAFEIARLNLFQMLSLTRIEGHPLLWYLILKPFSSIKFYPYSMYIINWFFCSCAVFVLWKKSPFNTWVKFLITFSTPFVFYFGTIARCYSIGLLFLFLICSEFKNRFKKPKLFSFLLLMCSNTSLLVFISCFYIWLVYLYQLIKKKSKNFKIAFYFFLLNAFLLFIQYFNFKKTNTVLKEDNNFLKILLRFFGIIHGGSSDILIIAFKITAIALFLYTMFHLFKKSKYALFCFISTYFTIIILFISFYCGSFWNYYFFFIYFIVLSWIFYRQFFSSKILKFLSVIFFVFMFFLLIVFGGKTISTTFTSKSKFIANFVAQNTDTHTKIYCLDWWSDVSPGADIYLLKKGIDIYDINGYKRTSFESIKKISTYENLVVDISAFYDSLDKNKKNYIVTDGTMIKKFKSNSNGTNFYLKSVIIDEKLNVGIFELVKK